MLVPPKQVALVPPSSHVCVTHKQEKLAATAGRRRSRKRREQDRTGEEGAEDQDRRRQSGFPQAQQRNMEIVDIPESERLAFCFSQWIALPDQPQISQFLLDLCSSIYNRMKVNEENNQEIYKRFLFHYSRAQDPAHKTGESQITTEEFTKKDSSGSLGRPFFLFRPRNGRKVSIDEH
uniref:Neuromedin-S n=1 Tax=Leptobrachium leishanense TaxID=445787 RepID=A0A8C5PAY9_9ANUR